MARKVYIIPKEMKVEDAYAEAERLGIGEICQGLSPNLVREGKIKEADLPIVYEEPIIPVIEPRNFGQEIDELIERVKKLEKL